MKGKRLVIAFVFAAALAGTATKVLADDGLWAALCATTGGSSDPMWWAYMCYALPN